MAMLSAEDIVAGARDIYGERLRGVLLFGSRVAGAPRPDSDLDVGVWLEPPLRRSATWRPWLERFGEAEPALDPTFFTAASLADPPGWLLEAARGGVHIAYDPNGALAAAVERLAGAIARGEIRRRLFMGLPYFERAAS